MSAEPGTDSRLKSSWSTVLSVVLGLFVASAFLSVNVFPVVGSDAMLYIEHSRDLFSGGLVEHGYRQVGYPVFLALTRFVANVTNAEPLLATVVVQRAMLLLVVYLAWRYWRWWSLFLIVVLVASDTLALSNYVLTESVAASLAILLVFPTVTFLQRLGREDFTRNLAWLGVLIVALVVGLYLLRFTFAVFAAVPLVLAIVGWRTPRRWLTFGMLGVTVVTIGVLALATSIENEAEHGEFFPSVEGDPVRYYFAWQQVFKVPPDVTLTDELLEFWDLGQVHHFTTEIRALKLSPREKKAAYDAEITAMFEAAGRSELGTQVDSLLYSLRGGRINDLRLDLIAAARREDVDSHIYLSGFARHWGKQTFANIYNDGQLAEVLITDPIGIPAPVASTSRLIAWLLPIGLLVMVVGLFVRSTRPLSAMGQLVVIAFAIGVGAIRADNFRFVWPTSAFGIAIATGVLATLAVEFRARQARSSVDSLQDDESKDGESLTQKRDIVDP
jgi:hypothetical protein